MFFFFTSFNIHFCRLLFLFDSFLQFSCLFNILITLLLTCYSFAILCTLMCCPLLYVYVVVLRCKKNRGKLSPFHFRFTISGDVISGDATSGGVTSGDVISGDATSGRTCARDHFRHHHTAPPQILSGWCFYTTNV